jgi:hypothetical protein
MARKTPKPLPIPPDALEDPGSIEMIRAWIANRGLHISLNIGIWKEHAVGEERAWGILLADAIRHIANALHESQGVDREDTIRAIKRQLDAELDGPTSRHRGRFVEPLADEDLS